MNISITDKTKSQKQFEVSISVEEMQPFIVRALKDLATQVNVSGFRQGKVPSDVVRSTLGEGKLWEEAAQRALEETLEKACKEHALDLISSPSIEVLQLAPGNDFRYRATVDVIPPFTLCDIRAVAHQVFEKEHREAKVENKEIEGALEWLAKSHAAFRNVSSEAKRGDLVKIQYEGKIAGVTQEGLEQKTETFVLGEDATPKGLEEALVGMKQGEEKDTEVTFPDSFPVPHLRNRGVDMHIALQQVKEREIPEINDDFAKTLGAFQNLDELKKNIQEGIHLEKQQKEEDRISMLQLEEIAKQSGVTAPQILVDQELERMKGEFSKELSQVGTTLPAYLEQIKKTEDDLKKGWLEKARERVNAGLVLRAIARQEHIEADRKEVEGRSQAILARYKNEKEAREHEGSPEVLHARIAFNIRNEKVLELLKTSC